MRLYTKPSGIWAVDYEDPDTGKRVRASTGVRDKAQARSIARDLVLGTLQRAVTPARRNPTNTRVAPVGSPEAAAANPRSMDAVWRRCELTVWHPREAKSQGTIKSNLKVLRAVTVAVGGRIIRFSDLDVGELRYSHLEALAGALRDQGYAPATVKRKMDMVSRSLTMAYKWDLTTGRPDMPPIRVNNARKRIMRPEEETAAFAALEVRRRDEPMRDWKRMGMLYRFLIDIGTRLGETLHARASWFEEAQLVDPATGEVRYQWFVVIPAWANKTNRERELPLTPAVAAFMPYLLENAVEVDGQPGGGRLFPYVPSSPWYHWSNLRDDLVAKGMDVSDVVLHTFRHTCLTRLHDRGVPIETISTWAGHASIQITADIYVKRTRESLLRAMAA